MSKDEVKYVSVDEPVRFGINWKKEDLTVFVEGEDDDIMIGLIMAFRKHPSFKEHVLKALFVQDKYEDKKIAELTGILKDEE